MVTTIQISQELKQELSSLKNNETYEEVISKLLKKHKKMLVAEQMQEYGKKHSNDSLKEVKEWETTDVKW
jgi:predicted CopG family antitoxin